MAQRTQQPQRQQTTGQPTSYDLNRVQTGTAKALGAIQAAALQFIPNEPKASNSPGAQLQAWLGADGTLKICVAKNSWFKFTGATF